jgi:DNA-binding NarL/FixJ family response regulator
MNNQIRIGLVDDECLFLEGLTLLFSNNINIEVVITSMGGNEFLDGIAQMPADRFPEIALIDIQMEPMNGFDLVELLKKNYPDLKIIILSSHYRAAMLGHMIKLGISAFLPKNANQALLYEAIEKVHLSGVFFTQKDHEMLRSFVSNKSQNIYFHPKDDLSPREIEVLQLICSEHNNQEIADKLFLSKRTVESHRQRLLEKIGTKNTVGLVVYAICNELYTPDSKYYN